MLDLNQIESDFRFDTDRKVIVGLQGAKPRRIYSAYELYYYANKLFDEPDMMIHPQPFYKPMGLDPSLFNGWSMDDAAKAAAPGITNTHNWR